jgi:DNA-binding response OmpR family regulator
MARSSIAWVIFAAVNLRQPAIAKGHRRVAGWYGRKDDRKMMVCHHLAVMLHFYPLMLEWLKPGRDIGSRRRGCAVEAVENGGRDKAGFMRVLLVEDSDRLVRSISTGLSKAGFAVDSTGNGADGLWRAKTGEYDVLILDIMLPGLDGLSILARLREQNVRTHVLILTAKDTVDDRVLGLRMGADDYLIKPFAFDELLARVQALARRSHGVKQSVIHIGSLEIDIVRRRARRDDTVIELAPRQFALLEYLAMRQGEVVSRTEIETHIYDHNSDPMSNVVDAAVYALRKRIDIPGTPSMIQTRRGMGYVLWVEPVVQKQ